MTDFPGPSTYTPLLRRFANERTLDLTEARELRSRLAGWQDRLSTSPERLTAGVVEHFDFLPDATARPFARAAKQLIEAERHIWELPDPAFERLTLAEFVEVRNGLLAKEHFFANQAEILAHLKKALATLLGGIARELPQTGIPTPFTIPLIHALPDARDTLDLILGTVEKYEEHALLGDLARTLWRNVCHQSGRDPDDDKSRRPLVIPSKSALPVDRLADAYLAETPLHQIFSAPVPLRLLREDRFNHMHVLGGSGAGKTTLIENLIRHDLASDDPPSVVLIDPHSDLVRKLVRSDLGIEDRVILIDPRDTEYPVALNPFAVNRERFGRYDDATKEQITAGVVQTFGFLWSGLTNLTLTGKQDVFFRYITRLMLTLPDALGRNATILDMLRLMQDPAPYQAAIDALPDIPREFFARDFMSKSFEGTKEQVRYRLQAIIESPTMARLFTAPETKVDLFTEMNRGAVILVDTAKDFLKEGSAVFGKLMISLILQAVLERAAIPETERKPTFLIVDEAASYFSNNIDDLLTEARKYRCGLLLAHQYLDQASGSLRASLAANAGIKLASGLSAADAAAMAREMRTSADMILAQPKLQFAAYIRGTTSSAVSVPIRPVERAPQLSGDRYAGLIERNRARVSLSSQVAPPTQSSTPPSEDISPDW